MGKLTKLAALAAGVGAGYALERLARNRLLGVDDSRMASDYRREPGEEGHVPGPHGEIYWHAGGEGTPQFLFVHGVTLNGSIWQFQMDALRVAHRVVAVDQRGHGRSAELEGPVTMSLLAEDVAAVIRALDLRDLVIVGHSLGGIVTQQFLVDHPELRDERVRGAVLVGTRPNGRMVTGSGVTFLEELAHIEERYVGAIAHRVMRLPVSKLVGNDASRFVARLGFGRRPPRGAVEYTHELISTCPERTLEFAVHGVLGFDVTGHLPDVPTPTLVVHGSWDMVIPLPVGRQIAELMPNARLEVVPGVGHMPMYEAPGVLTRLIEDFAASATSATSVTSSTSATSPEPARTV